MSSAEGPRSLELERGRAAKARRMQPRSRTCHAGQHPAVGLAGLAPHDRSQRGVGAVESGGSRIHRLTHVNALNSDVASGYGSLSLLRQAVNRRK